MATTYDPAFVVSMHYFKADAFLFVENDYHITPVEGIELYRHAFTICPSRLHGIEMHSHLNERVMHVSLMHPDHMQMQIIIASRPGVGSGWVPIVCKFIIYYQMVIRRASILKTGLALPY